jgi:hypothetical protein
MRIIFTLTIMILFVFCLSSCITPNFHSPETLDQGQFGVDAWTGYYYMPIMPYDPDYPAYAIGWHFGVMGRYGLFDQTEIGVKVSNPDITVYAKQQFTPKDDPLVISGVAELGSYSSYTALSLNAIAGYKLGIATPYAGLKNSAVMGLEGSIFDMTFLGDAFIGSDFKITDNIVLAAEMNYSYAWRMMDLGSLSFALGAKIH